MIQVLPAAKTFGGEFARNLGEGFSGAFSSEINKSMEEKQQQKKLSQSNKAIEDQLGIDLSGITDPKERQAILTQTMKNMGKQSEFEQKQSYLDNLFGGKKPSNGGYEPSKSTSQQLQSEGRQQDEPIPLPEGFDVTKITDEDIARASAIDPNIGRSLQHAKDVERRERTAATDLQYRKQTDQQRRVSESFKENDKYINKVYDSYEDAERKQAIFDRMDQLEESGQLSDSGTINLLESIGLKPEWLKNPANEEYTKLGLDTLGGGTLQADYGSRVLASEFKVSLQRIPSLSQTPEGRKQIKENLKAMLLPAKLKKERMQYYIEKSERTGEPLPHNLRGKVLQDIKPQLDEAYDAFKQRNGRYKVKEGTFPDDNALDKYYYLSDGNEKVARKMMEQDGYNVD